MAIFEKLSNGWTLSMSSLKVLKANKQLIIFPILSGISMVLLIGSFVVGVMAAADWDLGYLREQGKTFNYVAGFLFTS